MEAEYRKLATMGSPEQAAELMRWASLPDRKRYEQQAAAICDSAVATSTTR